MLSPLLSHVQVNDWQKDWVTFYAQQRIKPQMDMVEKKSGDREALELWSALQVSRALAARPKASHSNMFHLAPMSEGPRQVHPPESGSEQEVGACQHPLCPLKPGTVEWCCCLGMWSSM